MTSNNGLELYLLEDLANDLLEFYNKYHKRVVDIDDIVLWIYRKHNKKISLATILRKLRSARRKHLIGVRYKRIDFGSYKLRVDTEIIINQLACKALLLTTRTISLTRYMRG